MIALFTIVFVAMSLLCVYADTTSIYVCKASESALMGEYHLGEQKSDGVATFTNEHDMSFFRSRSFWYLGNLGPWPPETYYRCVEAEGCNAGMDTPPSTEEGVWTAAKRFGNEKFIPIVSKSSCIDNSEHEL